MIVAATRSGRGSVYGLRVRDEDRSIWFRPGWRWVTIWLPGEPWPVAVPVSESFWEESPELRSPRLRAFLERLGLEEWEAGHPPHFHLEPLGGGAFRLNWIEPVRTQPRLPIG